MNLLLNLKSRYLLIANSLLLLISSVLLVFYSGQWLYLLFPVTGTILFILARIGSKQNDDMHSKIGKLADEMCNGRLEYRITGIPDKNHYYDTAWKLNEALDQFESFMREVDAVFKATNENKFYRTTLAGGLHGDFALALTKFNNTVIISEKYFWQHKTNQLFSELGKLKIYCNAWQVIRGISTPSR